MAVSGGTFMDYMGTVMLGPRFKDGTTSLIEAMIRDSTAEVMLESPVFSVRQQEGKAVVETSKGSFSASAVICTSPLNALGNIVFDPPLNHIKREAVAEGQPGRGFKLWMVATGLSGGLFSMGAPGPFNHLFSLEEKDGETLLVGFGEGEAPNVEDPAAIQALLQEYVPEANLVACDLHDWRKDEYALGTWHVQSAGFTSRYEIEMRRPEGCLFLAGSDYSQHRPGYIDGAIESGGTVANAVLRHLQ